MSVLLIVTVFPFCCASAAGDIRGVWVSTVSNIDFPSKPGLSVKEMQTELDLIVDTCSSYGINTIFFQVRPNSDALYNSSVFPWSEVLTGTQGRAPQGGFDPLLYIIQKAHASGISLHAWINPYRIGDPSKLSASNPASLHPEWTISASDGKLYYNPAIPEVRSLILDGISEILDNYDIDGIHFDDYFYPYNTEGFDDSEQFAKYGSAFDDIGDFRRDNVNKLVSSVNALVHKKNNNLKFGISPFGIWANKSDMADGSETSGMSSYSVIYSDSRYWVQNRMVDYICPQVYWSFENTAAPFETLVRWWNSLCQNSGVDLYIGIALYKYGTDELGWKSQNQITRQLSLCSELSAVSGTVFFRYGCLSSLNASSQRAEISTSAFTSDKVIITGPANGYKTAGTACSVTGTADPSKPLTVNGNTVAMTQHGYFSAYLALDEGKNVFTFTNGDSTASVDVYRVPALESVPEMTDCFVNGTAFPSGDAAFFTGESVEFSVCAKAGTDVYAQIDGTEIPLTADSAYGTAVYSASYILPTFFSSSKLSVKFIARKDGAEYIYPDVCELTVICKPELYYTVSETYVYDSHTGGSMMDNYQLPAGIPVYVTARAGDMSRLNTGKWVYTSALSESLMSNPVTDIDTEKYVKATLAFESDFSFTSDLSDSGVLSVDVKHALGDSPSVKNKPNAVSVEIVRTGARSRVIVKRHGRAVTGFYVVPGKNNTLEIWVYNNTASGIAGKTVVIDPGHGGDDSGALGPAGANGASESDMNLSLSYILKQKLEAAGARVILTRTDDSLLLLKDRAGLIRSYLPDICISVHHNSVSRESDFNTATGVLTLYSRESSAPLSQALAIRLSNNTGLANMGAGLQSLNVCRDYRYPCVLLECGFVCNPQEYELLLTDSYKNTVCDNIILSLSDYFR